MKRLFKLGLVALMGVCGFVGISRAEDPEPTTTTKLASPTFTPESGNITPKSTIDFTLPEDLKEKILDDDYMGAAFILYVENDASVTLKTTADILYQAMSDAMGSEIGGLDGDEEATGTYAYKIGVIANTGEDLMTLVPVTISTESGAVTFRARLAVVSQDDNGDDIVLYSDEVTASYTVSGEVVVVKPTAPTFSLAEGTVTANATLTLSNGYTDMQAIMHPIYYAIDGTETDFTSVTNGNDLEASTVLNQYDEDEPITIDKSMKILAATAEINASGDVVWSDIVEKNYTVAAAPTTYAFSLTAVGATETTDGEGNTVQQFSTPEPQFTITAPADAPEGWYATVVAYTFEEGLVAVEGETDTLRADNPTKTFSTLMEGTEYLCLATVRGANHTQLWANYNSNGSGGVYFKTAGTAPAQKPTLAVKKAGTFTMNDDTIVFDGMAAFDAFVTMPAGSNNISDYSIVATYAKAKEYLDYMNFVEDDYTTFDIGTFDAADSVRIDFNAVYNGEYVAWFSLKENNAMAGEGIVDGSEVEFYFNVTNYAEQAPVPDPTFTVTAAGKHTMDADTVVFDSIATFKMSLIPAEGDTTTYRIMAQLFTKLAFDTMGDFITEYSYDAADTIAEFVGVWNGEYGVHFYAEKVYTKNGRPEEVGDATDFHFDVTNYAEPVYVDPEMTIAVAGKNELVGDTVVVFDGAAAFKMKVGEMSAGDSLKIAAVIYTKLAYDTFGEPITTDSYLATDTAAEFLGIYNGEYAVRFELQRYNLMLRDFALITDTVIYFNVTNYEEPVENYGLTAVPVGAGENNTFSTAEVAFDITVTGMTEADDDMMLYTTIFTKAQFADTVKVLPNKKEKAADSVRFETTLEDGEYVGLFELRRPMGRDTSVVEDFVLNFTVKKGEVPSAIESAELAGVNVYPNPNAGAFNVAVPERARVEIFGLNGAILMSREVNAGVAAFNLDHSGIYFVRVMAGNKTAVKRVIVR